MVLAWQDEPMSSSIWQKRYFSRGVCSERDKRNQSSLFVKCDMHQINIWYFRDLYVNIYQPIESDLYMHEVYIKQYAFQTRFVSIGVFFVLVILCSMTFVSLPVWLLRFSTVFAIAWLGICLLLLGIDMNSQILYVRKISTWWTSIRKKIRHIKP